MDFCPKCKSALTPVRKKNGVFLVCKKCGFSKKLSKKEKISILLTKVEEKVRDGVILSRSEGGKRYDEEREHEREETRDILLESLQEELEG